MLTPDLASIQAIAFTPICAPCHSGAEAPEGLQLDAGHAYSDLVGVRSQEQNNLFRVAPGDPTDSYLIQKLEGAPTISGMRMPYGGPYLAQSTIDVIAQWITNGAPNDPVAATVARSEAFTLVGASPPDGAVLTGPVGSIAAGFNHEVDASLVNAATFQLNAVPAAGAVAAPQPIPFSLALARGNPAAVLIQPRNGLPAGSYQVTIRGNAGNSLALADIDGHPLSTDQTFVFTVESP